MIQLLLASVLLAPGTTAAQGPDTQKVERAVKDLKDSLKSREAKERADAIARHRSLGDAEVVGLIARGLRDSADEVVSASIYALRYNEHPKALEALHRAYKDKKLRKRQEHYPALIQAIGQHANKSSIPLLANNAVTQSSKDAIRARILSLGNIRDRGSVDALMSLMRTAGRHRVQPYMREFRISLMILTGTDQGQNQDEWASWWNASRKSFDVARQAPELPAAQRRRWERFWGLRRTYDRPPKRGERGDDPETDGDRKKG